MKVISILLLAVLFIPHNLLSQIWTGDYTINTQEEADNFPQNCNCTKITGNLIFDDATMTNIDSLYKLNVVEGNVQITESINLSKIALPALDSIGGDFIVRANNKISSLEGLDNLRFIGNNFNLSRNSQLSSINGLDSLRIIGGEFLVFSNWNLLNIDGSMALKSVGKLRLINGTSDNADYLVSGFNNLQTAEEIDIFLPGKVGRIHGFEKLEEVIGNLKLEQNSQLYEIKAFENLNKIGNDLMLMGLNSLEVLDTFHALEEVSGTINLSGCRNLIKINAFTNLRKVGDIFIRSHSKLQEIIGFEELKEIQGNLSLQTNTELVRIPNFASLESINGAFDFSSNPLVDTLNVMPQLTEIEDLSLRINKRLKVVNGFASLKRITDELEISSNDSLKSIEGLQGLEYIRRLSVSLNQHLSDCCIFKCFIENEIIEGFTRIQLNGSGCNSIEEVIATVCEDKCVAVSTSLNYNKGFRIKLFPNPSRGKLYASLSKMAGRKLLVQIMDSQGRLLESVRYQSNQNSLSFDFPTKGLYMVTFLDLEDSSIVRTEKVLIY